MNIPQEIKDKIEQEANWRSTNGHGGVDVITRDNFILAAIYGYQLAKQEIEKLKSDLDLMDRREVAWGQKVKQVEEEIERLKGLIEKAHIIKIIQ